MSFRLLCLRALELICSSNRVQVSSSAPDNCLPIDVPNSSVADLQLELSQEIQHHLQNKWRVQTSAADHCPPIAVPKSPLAHLRLELSRETHHYLPEIIEHEQLRGPSSSSRPSPDFEMLQTNAPDDSESITCAYQL
eukprot:4563591-Pyramimonas_sp.AAC.1